MKKIKLFLGVSLFVESLMLLTVIIVLSIQKKSISKALFAALGAGSVLSAWLLLSYKQDEDRARKLREMDAFYDSDYELAYNGGDEEYNLGFDDNTVLIDSERID